MADYININGNNIPIRASDPSNPIEGEVWYNLTTNALKGRGVTTAAWASGGTYPFSGRIMFGAGTQTAAVIAGGFNGTVFVTTGNHYDGSAWTSSPSLNTTKGLGGSAGEQTSAVAFGGNGPSGANLTDSQDYNGSAWTSISSLPTGNQENVGFGTQTAAVSAGGTGDYDITLEWNGSAWSSEGNMNVLGSGKISAGTQTAGLVAGGNGPLGLSAATEHYDGSTWTSTGANMSVPRSQIYGSNTIASSGRDFAIAAGGTSSVGASPPNFSTASTDVYDGTSWSATANMSTARYGTVLGDKTAAMVVAGYANPPGANISPGATEEFSGAVPTTVTFSNS
jgi:hypothetical protein